MISYKNSKKILKKGIINIKDEKIKSINSLNRVLSSNIYSSIDYPAGDNAAFDGFAINSNDTKNIKKKISKFNAVEIMTGGILPKGFDTIIPIEQIVFYPNKENKKYILVNKKINRFKIIGN